MKKEIKEYPIENVLLEHVPLIFNFLPRRGISWRDINEGIGRFVEERKTRIESDGVSSDGVNFYDHIINTKEGVKESKYLLRFLNIILSDFDRILPKKKKVMVGDILRKMLYQFTENHIHFIGEIFVLGSMLESGEYQLDKVEYRIDNDKGIDFRMINKSNNEGVLIEVRNIFLRSWKLNSDTDIGDFLGEKFWEKIKENGDPNEFNYHIRPVLWGTTEDLEKVSEFYKRYTTIVETRVLEPYSYLCSEDENGEPYWIFGKISNLFD